VITEFDSVGWEEGCQGHSSVQRSQLYSLKPIGLGTANVESLTSYLTNLAKAHWVSVGDLLSEKFSTIIGKTYLTDTPSRGLHKVYNRTSALNGTGVMARDWVEAAQLLTLREDLHLLTLLTWSDVFPKRKLLRQHKAWCPLCYEDWRYSGQPLFEPLIWTIDVVELCPTHHVPLSIQCPHCSQKQPFLDWQAQLGHCSKCQKWLSTTSETQLSRSKEVEKAKENWQLWVAKNLGEVLTLQVQPPSKKRIAEAISICIKESTEGNIAAFSRMLDLPKNTVWQWQAGQVLPPLRELLRICHLLSIPLANILIKDNLTENIHELVPTQLVRVSKVLREPSRPFNSIQIYAVLEAEFLSHSCPPLTLEQVATSVGYAVRLLREHFPEICCAIAAKAKNYRKARQEQRVRKLSNEVEQVALQLHSNGVSISQANISKNLTKPGSIRDPQARLKLKNLQQELLISTVSEDFLVCLEDNE
jgi:hypothetical protein